jgi:hypothetical protein
VNAPPVATATAFPDERIRRRLWIMLCIYEALIISIVAAAGLNISLTGGGSVFLAAPLLLISCAGALRIPLSAMASRLHWQSQLLAAIALLGIAVGSAEGLGVAFESFLQNRVVDIMRANGAVDRAQRTVDREAATNTNLAGEVTALDAQIAAQAAVRPSPPAASNRTCTWRGQRVSCSADASAIAVYRETQKAYDARLASLSSQRDAARAKQMSAVSPGALDALAEAKQAFEEKADQSPVWRLTAAVFGESSSEVTPAQFSKVKAFVTATLAIGFASLSMAVSIVVHAKTRGEAPNEAPSKLARASRAYLARRRKRLVVYRDVPGPVQFRDRTIFKYVATDPVSGRVLDPDARP